ncbi:uncharacterized protein LDX57_006914 [Aspergillus melleus]|uniref:uncharacterized protein n=1 Tax=Aspergillus melleus TaxID=138277 RepID=UPI001E8E0EF7|nr:uncharacterized protein LDX57_006914 [Aspergillus melleus]KAH8429247.1 hypothetical protein LDX57_006914 [Aspergillus melleus]
MYTETAVGDPSSAEPRNSRELSLHSDSSPTTNHSSALTEVATPEPLQRHHLEHGPFLEGVLSDLRHPSSGVGDDSDPALTEIVAPVPVQRHVEKLRLRPGSLERSLSNASHDNAQKSTTRSCNIF